MTYLMEQGCAVKRGSGDALPGGALDPQSFQVSYTEQDARLRAEAIVDIQKSNWTHGHSNSRLALLAAATPTLGDSPAGRQRLKELQGQSPQGSQRRPTPRLPRRLARRRRRREERKGEQSPVFLTSPAAAGATELFTSMAQVVQLQNLFDAMVGSWIMLFRFPADGTKEVVKIKSIDVERGIISLVGPTTHAYPATSLLTVTGAPRLEAPSTASSSAARTPPPTPAPTPSLTAKAVGDPHLVNVFGQRFDLVKTGIHTMVTIPKRAKPHQMLLGVTAVVEQHGGACEDMYLMALNITGRWTHGNHKSPRLKHYSAHTPAHGKRSTGWVRYGGRVSLKVVWGTTKTSVPYLNLLVRDLQHAGYAVGGLLGEDDHTEAATPRTNCRRSINL